jgi:RsiW-degrading membrane proteinase PrsW (M82 family)
VERAAILVAAFTPALAVLVYGIARSRANCRSEALWNPMFMGAMAAIAVIPVELALSFLLKSAHLAPAWHAGIEALLIAALPEETAKFTVLVAMVEPQPDIRRKQDVLVAALAVGLGFAGFENFLYLAAPAGWLDVAALRAGTAVPGHGLFAMAMGALLTAARLQAVPSRLQRAAPLLVPIVLHAAYDFPLLLAEADNTAQAAIPIWIGTLPLLAAIAILLWNKALAAARAADRLSPQVMTITPLSTPILVLLAAAFLLLAAVFALLGYHSEHASYALGLGVLPAALGADLLLAAFRRAH